MERIKQFLDHMYTNPNAVICFFISDMILNMHSDEFFQTVNKARSRAGSYFFLLSCPKDNEPININGIIYVVCTIIKLDAASAIEAELGALLLNTQEAKIWDSQLKHPQLLTPIHIDNSTCVEIANNTQK